MTPPQPPAVPDDSSLVRMIDQHGQPVALDVRQDGRAPGLVPPGRRVRFRVRTDTLAYRIHRLVLPECPQDWHVYDVYVGSRSQFSGVNPADIPENDGVPGEMFSAQVSDDFVRFETVQTAMDLTIDVAYRGPVTGGAPFACHLQSTVVYGDERDRAAGDAGADTDTPRPAGPLFVAPWRSFLFP